jgi:hypothetical protein
MSRPMRSNAKSAASTSRTRRDWSAKPCTGPVMNSDTNAMTIVLMTSVTTSSISVNPCCRFGVRTVYSVL